MSSVYLNGEFLPIEEARISVLDRGFLFGDGIYEVIPAYNRKLFRLAEHLLRLQNSLDGIRLANPHPAARWQEILEALVADNAGDNQSVYLQITRGADSKRDHPFPVNVPATVFAMSTPIAPIPASLAEHGIGAITLDDIRWQLCNLKAITLLPNVLLRQTAIDHGAAEAILLRGGMAVEGAASNLFIVKDGCVITPPKGPQLLPGITRDLILELAMQHGLAHREADISEAQLRDADEIWLTSSTKEILPVTKLDNHPVSGGRPGPVWQVMIAHYQAYKASLGR